MSDWRRMEEDFKTVNDPYITADWYCQEEEIERWNIAAASLTKRKIETLAKIAGNMLLSSQAAINRFSKRTLSEPNSDIRWFKALKETGHNFKYIEPLRVPDSNGNESLVFLGSIINLVEVSKQICLELASDEQEIDMRLNRLPWRLYIDNIDSFAEVRKIDATQVTGLLNKNGRVEIEEDVVQRAIEKILTVPFHKGDWGGEENDLYTSNLILEGNRIAAAFALKGKGCKRKLLQIKDCGKNGDQIVRLFQSPAQVFIIQYIGEIADSIIKDMEEKVRSLRLQGKIAWYCVINGQDTVRLLRAYKKSNDTGQL